MTLTATEFFSRPAGAVDLADEARFFARIKLRNSTFKRTDPGRFADLDDALIARLEKRGVPGEALDIAISSGMTTLELDLALKQAGHTLRLTATDLAISALIVNLGGNWRALVDGTGHVLQYEYRGVALQPWRRRLDYVTGMALVRAVANWRLAPRARAALAERRIVRTVDLVSPRLRARSDIDLRQDDVTVRNPAFSGRFRVIRAANILNHGYFDEAVLRRAVANLVSYLDGPGALLLIVRTVGGGQHHGTLFRVAPDGVALDVLERFGDGSEIEDLVAAPATRQAA